jgi:hypothetical protein
MLLLGFVRSLLVYCQRRDSTKCLGISSCYSSIFVATFANGSTCSKSENDAQKDASYSQVSRTTSVDVLSSRIATKLECRR